VLNKPWAIQPFLDAKARNDQPGRPEYIPLYEIILGLQDQDDTEDTRQIYLHIVDQVFAWDSSQKLARLRINALERAMLSDNFIGVEKFVTIGLVDHTSLGTKLKASGASKRSTEWNSLLRYYGAQDSSAQINLQAGQWETEVPL
jgi:hypothetical protein